MGVVTHEEGHQKNVSTVPLRIGSSCGWFVVVSD